MWVSWKEEGVWGSNHEAEVVRRSTVKRQYTFMLSCVIRVGVDEDQVLMSRRIIFSGVLDSGFVERGAGGLRVV